MKITSADFLKSAAHPDQFPRDRRPEVAFVGRSNVGKSSLLNRLLGRKNLAKTSSTPGKTRTVNFFDINGVLYFVDLPGYGFAKVPKSVKEKWDALMLSYLKERPPLRLVIQLIDIRHAPTPKDVEMIDFLAEAEVPTLLVATKSDKLSAKQRENALRTIRKDLELDQTAMIIPFSSITGEGVKPLWDTIEAQIVEGA